MALYWLDFFAIQQDARGPVPAGGEIGADHSAQAADGLAQWLRVTESVGNCVSYRTTVLSQNQRVHMLDFVGQLHQ